MDLARAVRGVKMLVGKEGCVWEESGEVEEGEGNG